MQKSVGTPSHMEGESSLHLPYYQVAVPHKSQESFSDCFISHTPMDESSPMIAATMDTYFQPILPPSIDRVDLRDSCSHSIHKSLPSGSEELTQGVTNHTLTIKPINYATDDREQRTKVHQNQNSTNTRSTYLHSQYTRHQTHIHCISPRFSIQTLHSYMVDRPPPSFHLTLQSEQQNSPDCPLAHSSLSNTCLDTQHTILHLPRSISRPIKDNTTPCIPTRARMERPYARSNSEQTVPL